MTQKERLVELLKSCPDNYLFMVDGDFDLFESLADCLLDNGVIVPPCKVGDTVYVIDDGIVYEEKVDFFDLSVATDCGFHSAIDVFTTREEAEQALKERET